jgi:flagellar biosynthesis protein FliR
MKKTNLLYWIITGLFAAFMTYSAIPSIAMAPEAVNMITGLGYPKYFVPFSGVAKLLGSIAILIPGLKE